MKLAILGAGMIVKDFLIMVESIPEIELKAIIGVEQDLETMKELQTRYSIHAIYTDFDECLNNETIDTVYIALPNHLHYIFAKKALEKDKNVICEKPFTLSLEELSKLEELAEEKNVILIEAITNQYLSNYKMIQKDLSNIGDLKIIECNYSQYSSRYDQFKKGIILPAFDPKKGGGALMDINIYNIHFVIGLMGRPLSVQYLANIEHGVDTSGVLILDYGTTKVTCIGAKDSSADIRSTIQGTNGAIVVNGPTNMVRSYTKQAQTQAAEEFNYNVHEHRMYEEFKQFAKIILENNRDLARQRMQHSKLVMEVIDLALKSADLR
ncbi:hypothetical protein OMY_00592 [Enterococcus sulfureus ATCC 49903]|uniref:Gfo/Idh/MocA-like oxidoreductase N-terminal domain-containing protein n=1 Tax=Enterococcus sulfureus ATCC 49903 TaxID=1140003 RepID=S0P1V5_9ENTE|nr:Gfo/Idh/MocA family oxidoreductase [Enterococcus sulfureus]EOT48637.1 hypothetical protein OMY_00592 [Enterococcus sulfureus ATCC 49903]EOT87529.1 hypothetical protein I573_00585 [Enterococcus sulfureus ATCC 49903]